MKTPKFFLSRKIIHQLIACLLVFCIVNLPAWALNWHQGTNASFNGTDTVTVNAQRSVIEWNDFDTNPGQLLSFLANGSALTSDYAVLNKVIGINPTLFQGILKGGQGHIILFNPNGITLGAGAVIDAGRFTASTMNLQMSDAEFLNINNPIIMSFKNNSSATVEVESGATINAHDIALLGSTVLNKGAIVSDGGLIVLAAGDEIYLGSNSSDILVALDTTPVSGAAYNVTNDVAGRIESPEGTIVMAAGDTFAQAISHPAAAYPVNTHTVEQKGHVEAATVELAAANEVAVRSGSTTTADEAMNIGAAKVRLENTLASNGNLTMDADFGINALADITSQEAMEITADSVQVRGDIVSGSTAAITADNLYSKGDITSQDNLLLDADTTLWGETDQHIRSEASVTSDGTISKTQGGDLYISAADNVRLDGDVSAVEFGNHGGVSVIAENGKIHTGDGTDTLNVAIKGYSNDITEDAGVELPNGQGKAAIVLQSHDTLKLGPDAALIAGGFYLSGKDNPAFGVDDRTSMDWLARDGEFIGGWERDEGITSDVAIYVGSKTGNVEVSTVKIQTAQPGLSEWINNKQVVSGPSTVVFDAYDTVTMPSIKTITNSRSNKGSENNYRNFRLEVDSRITEWLYQAVQNETLPYASDPEAVEDMLGQDYVLRGAGLDNPAINDGRAWVLENPPVNTVAPLPVLQLPYYKGCPVELEAVANELSVNSDDVQILINNALAANPNLQPCQACQRVMIAVGALRDEDGARLAAMNTVFNALAPIDAPFTPEVSASVTNALADLADSDPQYALAADYIDSFVDYVAVINGQLKAPVGDPLVYALNKYGQTLMSAPNQNIVSYLVAQVEVVKETVTE
jgi:filamentous hemagglutinin family protein